MASQRHNQYSTGGLDPGDGLTDKDWRSPGCGPACRRIRVLVIGDAMTRFIVIHDALAHEDYGMGIADVGSRQTETVTTGGLVIDPKRFRVDVNGQPRYLARLQLRILLYLAQHLDSAVFSSRLIDAVWGDSSDTIGLHVVHVAITRLRNGIYPCGDLIVTVPGIGYRLRSVTETIAYTSNAPPKPWSRNYAACIGCSTTDRPYARQGYCSACLWKYIRSKEQTP